MSEEVGVPCPSGHTPVSAPAHGGSVDRYLDGPGSTYVERLHAAGECQNVKPIRLSLRNVAIGEMIWPVGMGVEDPGDFPIMCLGMEEGVIALLGVDGK